jgi:hypothetical protein
LRSSSREERGDHEIMMRGVALFFVESPPTTAACERGGWRRILYVHQTYVKK